MSFDVFLALLRSHGLPEPQTEFCFLKPARNFRADYCWPEAMLIVEKNGGIFRGGKGGGFARGGHSMGFGVLRDMEKANLAQLAGWLYLQYEPRQLLLPSTLETLKTVLLPDSIATRRPA